MAEAASGVASAAACSNETLTQVCEGIDDYAVAYLQLLVVCFASFKIAFWMASLPVLSLPRGSGFLCTGLLASLSGMIYRRKCYMIDHVDGSGNAIRLDFYAPINWVCMSFIAYATGSELVLDRYRGLVRRMAVTTTSIMSCVFLLVTVFSYLLLTVPAMLQFDLPSDGCEGLGEGEGTNKAIAAMFSDPKPRWAISVLLGAIFTSRSPASAISIVGEMRAKGTFTQTALGVTIFMYIGANILFSVMSAIAVSLVGSQRQLWAIIVSVFVGLLLSIVLGFVLGFLLFGIIGLPIRLLLKRAFRLRSPLFEIYAKALLSLSLGLGLFLLRLYFRTIELGDFRLQLEPLLSCLIGGAFVVNYRNGSRRLAWAKMCSSCSLYIYCGFFTLGGSSMNLRALASTQFRGPVTIMSIRMCAIVLGAFGSGFVLRDQWAMTRISWMNYITQAGVALGFAQEVRTMSFEAIYDQEMRDYIYILVIAAVCINQIIGPPLFKLALRISGEAHYDRIGGSKLITVEGQSPQVEMKHLSWEVRNGVGGSHVAQIVKATVGSRNGTAFRASSLVAFLGHPKKEVTREAEFAFVSMQEDDAANYEACQLAQRLYRARRCIVPLIDPEWQSKFEDMGVLVVDPSTIAIGSIDQLLSSAQAAEMLLHNSPNATVVKVDVDMELAGVTLQQIQFPPDVQVLDLSRANAVVVPRAFTKFQYGDVVTLCGKPSSLSAVTAIKKGRVVLVNSRARRRTSSISAPSSPTGSLSSSSSPYRFRFNRAGRKVAVAPFKR